MSVPAVVLAVYVIVAVSWAVTNAPFTAPDESQHYLRAVGISTGHLIGYHADYSGPILSPKETAWRHHLTRAVSVPAGLSPDGLDCELFHPSLTPACGATVTPNRRRVLEQTDVGVYQPAPYLLPAVAVRLASRPAAADRAGRLAMVLLWSALLAAAIWMLWDVAAGPLSLVGLVVAITPTVVFMGSGLTDSSLEIMASLAFFAALLRLTRGASDSRAGPLVVAGIAGAVLVLSRSLGPLWLVCGAALALALAGTGPLLATARRLARPTLVAAALIVGAVVLNVAWVSTYGPHVSVTVFPSASALHDGLSQLRAAWRGVIGLFGYEDVPLGGAGVAVWSLLAALLVVAAMYFGRSRERVTLLIGIALAIVLPIYIYAAVTSNEGIETQGRHILPLLITVPLLAGEILRRRVRELPVSFARFLFPATVVAAAAVQLLAWWENSRRYAVGLHGSWWFLSDAKWSPPGGWPIWVIVVVATTLAAIAAALTSIRPARASHAET